MKGIFTRRNIWIIAIVGVIALSAVIVAFATGNTKYPGLSNPDEVFYQRLDDQGNVVYEITNEELFEKMKSNDGIQQLLYITDTVLLAEYIEAVDDTEIAEKILELTYGTSDQEIIDELSVEQNEEYVNAFNQQMTLAGYTDNVNGYARLMVARDDFARDYADENGLITNYSILSKYLNNYYEDVQAINIRFTSETDALNVMHEFNLVSTDNELRSYKGFVFKDEDLTEGETGSETIIEAIESVTVYYFDTFDNLVDLDDEVVYTNGSNGVYVAVSDSSQYTLDAGTNNLYDGESEIVVFGTNIFETKSEAETYKEDNTITYEVTKVNPFDENEDTLITDGHVTVYTVNADGHIFDIENNDITYSNEIELVINKVYTPIEDASSFTENNTDELTDEEILLAYVKMYNYVYGQYRTTLDESDTLEDLIRSDNDDLLYNYDELLEDNSSLASYLFGELTIDEDTDQFSIEPEYLENGSGDFYHLVYKLYEPTKEDILDEIFDSVKDTVIIPSEIASDYAFPTTTYYNGSIAWSSANSTVISSAGIVENPETDTTVILTYNINILGETKSYDVTITVKAEEADNSEVTEPEYTELTLSDLITDQTLEDTLYNELLDDYIDTAENVDNALFETRTELGFQIYDKYLELDYLEIDANYVSDNNGDDSLICSFDNTLTSEEAYTVNVDEYFETVMNNNSALYLLYSAQEKELIYSMYYTQIYGEETEVNKNNSDAMDNMYAQVTSAKSQYSYYESLYSQMGSAFPYDSFSDYSYASYGAKTELGLLQYFAASSLQAFLIQETIDEYDVITNLTDEVEEYYTNYFDMYVSHILIHLDFDEDGSPDDYYEYKDELEASGDLAAFNTLVGLFETAIGDYSGTIDELVDEYNDAARDDETWGQFKQAGFLIVSQDLNYLDEETGDSYSRTYHGDTTGSKGVFVDEFTEALVEIYDLYSVEPASLKNSYTSDIVETKFGIHKIEVTKGSQFEQPSAEFPTEDSELDPADYSTGSVNTEEMPTSAQMELYAQYFFYNMVYDLSDADVEDKYDIVVPNLPDSVEDALDVYFADLLSSIYVVGGVNIAMVDRLVGTDTLPGGSFSTTTYSDKTNDELMAELAIVKNVYYEAILEDYMPAE